MRTYYKSIYLVLLLSSLLNTRLAAQNDWTNGYIITNSGEKKEGLIEYLAINRLNSICHFKLNETGNIQEYLPGEIQVYGFDEAKFASKAFQINLDGAKNESVFAECLFESKKYVLYRYKRQYIIEDKTANAEPFRFGFESSNGSADQKKDETRLLALTQSLLSEMGVSVENLTNSLPSVSKLKKILVGHHQSKGIPFQIYQDARSDMQLILGWIELAAGQEIGAKISTSDVFESASLSTASSYGISLPIQFSQHPTYGRLSFMALPGLRKVKYGFEQTQQFRTYNFAYEATYLQSAFLLKYNLMPARKTVQIGVYAGPNLRGLLNNSTKMNESYLNINNRDTVLMRDILSLSGNLDVDALVGLDLGFNTKKSGQFYVGIRSQITPFKRNFLFGTNERSFTVQSLPISLFLGYRPKIKLGFGKK